MSIQEIRDISKAIKGQNLIDEYVKNQLTIREISKKYNLSRAFISDLLRYNNIHIKESFITKNNNEVFESDIGKKIIEEYKQPGNNIRSLARKYNLCRRTVSIIFKHANVKLKNEKEVKREYKDLGLSTGKNHHNYGKLPPAGAGRCRWYHFNDKTYQGTWEFKLGLWLEQQNKRFYCHENVKRFQYQINGVDKTYCPDFYLIDDNVFIEVKGYFTKDDRQKIDAVRQLYPNEKIEIFDQNKLRDLKILDIDKTLDILLDQYQINYKDDTSLNGFIEQYENRKVEIIKDYLIRKMNLTEIANKYSTTYRVIDQIYHLWIETYYKNKKQREMFVVLNCKDEINDQYRVNCNLNKLVKKYRISRKLLNSIISEDAKIERLNEQQKKFNKNYKQHLLKFNLPVITDELVKQILMQYEDDKSMRQICKMYNLRKKKVKQILVDNNVYVRSENYYNAKRWM